MSVAEKSRFLTFLEERTQGEWNRLLTDVLPSVHPVDRTATLVWFAFWPLELHEALGAPEGEAEMARVMDLEGEWKLARQIDRSVSFLYGARYWPAVKREALALAEEAAGATTDDLERAVRDLARRVAEAEGVDVALTLGIAAVGLMMLRQVGPEALGAVVGSPAEGEPPAGTPDAIVARRARKRHDKLLALVRGVARRYRVVWDERRPDGSFEALLGQDLATAAAKDRRDFRGLDPRRIEGPIPVECRVGSCGYCWVGVLAGRERLAPLSEFEKKRLAYFGYDTVNHPDDPTPPIRLACQAQCEGDVTLVIPPWNGELKRRFDRTAKVLGTV